MHPFNAKLQTALVPNFSEKLLLSIVLSRAESLCAIHCIFFIAFEHPRSRSSIASIMSAAAARAALRPSRFAIRHTPARNASTTSETASSAASKAKETASNVTSKASEGLTRVQESAGSVASSAGSAASTAAAGVQGRVGRLVSTVQCTFGQISQIDSVCPPTECWTDLSCIALIPPTVYYSKVGLELGKLVVHGQKMAPPYVLIVFDYAVSSKTEQIN